MKTAPKGLLDFPKLHPRSKLAQICVITEITYFLLARYPEVGIDTLEDLDVAFEDFYAHTLKFPELYHKPDNCDDSKAYQHTLKQICFNICDGGPGLTSANCFAPAALYATMLDFVIWWDTHEELKVRASETYAAANITCALDSMEQCGGIQ